MRTKKITSAIIVVIIDNDRLLFCIMREQIAAHMIYIITVPFPRYHCPVQLNAQPPSFGNPNLLALGVIEAINGNTILSSLSTISSLCACLAHLIQTIPRGMVILYVDSLTCMSTISLRLYLALGTE